MYGCKPPFPSTSIPITITHLQYIRTTVWCTFLCLLYSTVYSPDWYTTYLQLCIPTLCMYIHTLGLLYVHEAYYTCKPNKLCTLTNYLSSNRGCCIAGCLSSWVPFVQSQCCILCALGSTCVCTVCRHFQTFFSAYRNSSSVLLRSSVSAAKQNAEMYSTSCIQKKTNSLQCIVHTV